MAFKPIDPKRDEFRRYLERAGVIETLTKVFVRIVKERPENPIEYLRHNLGDSLQQTDYVTYLQTELEEGRCEIQRLRELIQNINPEALGEPRVEADANQSKENGVERNIDEKVSNENRITDDTIATTAAISAIVLSEISTPDVPTQPNDNDSGAVVQSSDSNEENPSALTVKNDNKL